MSIEKRVAGAVVGLLGLLLAMAPADAARQRFGETVDVVTVEVPVQVVAGGKPVRGLTKESFELFVDGKRHPITGFEVIDLATIDGDESQALPVAARRHFMLLFDLSFSQPDGVIKAREAARGLVENSFHPSDLVAVATYTLNRGPKLVLSFTPDRRQLASALDDLGLQQYDERFADPLGLVVALDPVQRSSADVGLGTGVGGGIGGTGINGPAAIRQHLADLSIATARVAREQQIDRARQYTSSFKELAEMLHGVRGRKQVVLFSEGFDATAILGTGSADRAIETARSATRGEYWKVDSDERFGSTATLGFLEDMLEAFRRADAVIQAVDVGGARALSRSESAAQTGGLVNISASQGLTSRSENSLFVMADATGGELYRNFNDLDTAMAQLLERTGVTYMLSFSPKKLKADDGFQRLRVKLKDAPRGARAVHRPGFYPPTPYRDQSALMRQLQAADLVLDSADGGDFAINAWAVAAKASDGSPEMLVFFEVDGGSLLEKQEHDLARLRLFAYAIDGEGGIGDFITQAVQLDLDHVERSIAKGGLLFFGRLRLDPGSYRIRTVLQDARSGRHGLKTVRVDVTAEEDGRPSLAPPLFPLEDDAGLLLLENDSRREATAYPLGDDEIAFVPRSQVTVGDQSMKVLVAGYASASARLDAWIEDEGGKRLDGHVDVIQPLASADEGSRRAMLSIDPAGLRGTHRLIIRLSDHGQTATRGATLIANRP